MYNLNCFESFWAGFFHSGDATGKLEGGQWFFISLCLLHGSLWPWKETSTKGWATYWLAIYLGHRQRTPLLPAPPSLLFITSRVFWVFSVVSTQSNLFQFNKYLLSCIHVLTLFLLLWVQYKTKLISLVYDLQTFQWRRKAINLEGSCVNIDGVL